MSSKSSVLFRNSLDQLLFFLPVLLLIVLAMLSYWLMQSTPNTPEKVTHAERPLQHPDYFLNQFKVFTFDAQGRFRNELAGTQARHMPQNDTYEIDQIRVNAYTPSGLTMRAQALRGISNADSSEVQLLGQAQLHREPTPVLLPMTFNSEFLHFYTIEERVETHLPVSANDTRSTFNALSMNYNAATGQANFSGAIQAQIVPKL